MSNKNEIPEVDIVVDHEAGVIREVKPQQTRRDTSAGSTQVYIPF